MPDGFNPSEWITTSEAAELTGYSDVHIRSLAKHGQIQGQKSGNVWMINQASVLTHAEEMKNLGAAKHDPRRNGSRAKTTDE